MAKKSKTVSVALPGCILDKAQTPLLKTYLAGQIARALTIFRVDEVIIFSENGCKIPAVTSNSKDPNLYLYKLLTFLEAPPYLRRFLYSISEVYQHIAVIKPLESLHHPLRDSGIKYRDGVVTEHDEKNKKSIINVGLKTPCKIKGILPLKQRVKVKISKPKKSSKTEQIDEKLPIKAKIISKKRFKEKLGFTGYEARLCNGIKEVFSKSPFENGYDLTLGTSERGKDLDGIMEENINYNHLLVVLGGPKGLENCLNERKQKFKVENLFDHYVNAGVLQGSRTIRTEEALLVVMSALRKFIQ